MENYSWAFPSQTLGWRGPWRIPLCHSPPLPQASGDIGLEGLFFPMFPVFEGPIFAGIAPGRGCQAVRQGGGLLGNLTDFLSCVCGRSTLLLTPRISGFSGWRGGGETCEWRQWPLWSSSSLGGLHCGVSRENCPVSCRGSVLSRAEPPVWLAVGADRALHERARGSWGGGPVGAHMPPGWQRDQSLG